MLYPTFAESMLSDAEIADPTIFKKKQKKVSKLFTLKDYTEIENTRLFLVSVSDIIIKLIGI